MTFRYLDGRAFPKAENSMGSKFYFSHWKIHFSQFIFIDKYLIFKEIEYFIQYIKFET